MCIRDRKQNGEKCTGTFTKRIGNTTYRVNVHFEEDTTDTVADKLLHLMGMVAPVSYTHLDVYKRQALPCAIGRCLVSLIF